MPKQSMLGSSRLVRDQEIASSTLAYQTGEYMAYLGYLECSCGKYTYITRPQDIVIWFHPDDGARAQTTCFYCGDIIRDKIGQDHYNNFIRLGCTISDFNGMFTALTEEMVDEWDMSELEREMV